MVQTKQLLSRTTAIATAAALVSAALVPALIFARANAGLPTTRSITMSTSVAAATDVTYTVGFTTATTSNIGGVVIDFCDSISSGTPIIGDSNCPAPVGFNTKYATGLVLGTQVGITGLSIDATNSTASKLVLTRSVSSINSAVGVTIPLGTAGAGDGVTNPSVGNQTFYARILTFDTAAGAQGYTSGTPGTYVDAGGIALSTANQIQITSKVQERLSFCVYDRANCAAGTSGIALGNFQGVLDTAGEYVDKQAKFDIATNALSGASVVMKGDTLKSGAFDITAIGGTSAATNPSNEQFGMCLWQSAGAGLTLPNATYNNANCNTVTQTAGPSGTGTNTVGGAGTAQFGFNTTNTTSASGETIASKPAGNSSTANLAFIGNIAYTTEAGIYTTNLTFIATGTY
jgi:hypothetical protein